MSDPSDPDFEGYPGTGLGYGINQVRDALGSLLKAQGVDTAALDEGSAHDYWCTCETCWTWWKTMGLGDEESPPFNQAQIEADSYEAAIQLAPAVEVVGLPEHMFAEHRANMAANPCAYGNHTWVADPNKRQYKCANCPAEAKV